MDEYIRKQLIVGDESRYKYLIGIVQALEINLFELRNQEVTAEYGYRMSVSKVNDNKVFIKHPGIPPGVRLFLPKAEEIDRYINNAGEFSVIYIFTSFPFTKNNEVNRPLMRAEHYRYKCRIVLYNENRRFGADEYDSDVDDIEKAKQSFKEPCIVYNKTDSFFLSDGSVKLSERIRSEYIQDFKNADDNFKTLLDQGSDFLFVFFSFSDRDTELLYKLDFEKIQKYEGKYVYDKYTEACKEFIFENKEAFTKENIKKFYEYILEKIVSTNEIDRLSQKAYEEARVYYKSWMAKRKRGGVMGSNEEEYKSQITPEFKRFFFERVNKFITNMLSNIIFKTAEDKLNYIHEKLFDKSRGES